MSGVRRRKAGRDDGNETLTESLLAEEAEESVPYSAPSRQTAIIVHPGEFNLQSFVSYILDWWRRVWGQLSSCATSIWPASEPKVSLIQSERLEELRDKVSVRFDIGNEEHQNMLRRLWALAFPGVPCTALKTPDWKQMGWQGDDPATDFRGAGLYGLENLVYLGEAHPETFRMLLDKAEGTRAQWEYPFAVAGLNLTFMLAELLELQHPQPGSRGPQPTVSGAPRTAAARGFLPLLSDGESAFEELYCASFCLLDSTWLSMRASYMEFNAVMKRVKAQVETALASRPTNMQALRVKLMGE